MRRGHTGTAVDGHLVTGPNTHGREPISQDFRRSEGPVDGHVVRRRRTDSAGNVAGNRVDDFVFAAEAISGPTVEQESLLGKHLCLLRVENVALKKQVADMQKELQGCIELIGHVGL